MCENELFYPKITCGQNLKHQTMNEQLYFFQKEWGDCLTLFFTKTK
jgi:hypothetical protein